MKNAKELRKEFLQNSSMVFDEIKARTLGRKSPHPNADEPFLKMYWDALVPIIHAADDIQKLKATSTGDIIKLLGKGKITIQESLLLMELIKGRAEVDLAPALLAELKKINKK